MLILSKKQFIYIFILIIFGALFLRVLNFTSFDVISDEAVLGIRSIGYIDFFMSQFQTTPYDWYGAGDMPWWVKLSFHDHPPLVFFIQHLFFSIFGTGLVALRLPSVLFGILSIYLVWVTVKNMYAVFKPDENLKKVYATSLFASFVLSVSAYHTWISRIGLQESVVIFLNLAVVFFLIKALGDKKYYIWWGIFLGLAMLAKYTSVVVAVFSIFYILLARYKDLKSRYFLKGALIALAVFSPVIFYNVFMYLDRGHFDFQISYLIGQDVPEWVYRMGREQAGGLFDRIVNLFPNLWQGSSMGLNILWATAFFYLIFQSIKYIRQKNFFTIDVFLSLAVVLHLLLFIVIGPQERFLAMIVPYLAILSAYYGVKFLFWIYSKSINYSLLFAFLLVFVLGYEVYFNIQTNINTKSVTGKQGIDYSVLKLNSLYWGFNDIDRYMQENIYSRHYPAFTFPTKYRFLENIKRESIQKAQRKGKTPLPALFIYDQNMNSESIVWYIYRPFIYQGWPYISADTYFKILQSEGDDFFIRQGVEKFYFIKAEHTLLRKEKEFISSSADNLSKMLDKNKTPYYSIYAHNKEAVRIYYWDGRS